MAFKVQIDLNPKNPPAQITDVLYSPKKQKDEEEMKLDSRGLPVSPPSTTASESGPDPAVQFTKQIRLKKQYMSECKFWVNA